MRRVVVTAVLLLLSSRADARSGGLCDMEATTTCGAGRLPRLSHRDWGEEDTRRFRERARQGTVAVAITVGTGKARVLPGCKLPGTYAKIKTQPGSGSLWITNRALMVLDEIPTDACSGATHQVAAFAVGREAAKTEAPPAAVPFAAVLVPLPCPSIADISPAGGCIAAGSTGPERQARAHSLIDRLGRDMPSKADPADVLIAYAMAPDDARTRNYVARINTECSMSKQVGWVLGQYMNAMTARGETVFQVIPQNDPRRNEVPLDFHVDLSDQNCLYQPPFRKCFPDIAPSSPGYTGCWDYADSTIAPRTVAQPAPAATPSKPAPTAAPAAGCAPAPSPTTPKKAPAP